MSAALLTMGRGHAVAVAALISARVVALFAVTPGALAAAQAFPHDTMIDAILRDRVDSKRAVGLVVATYSAGTPLRIFAHGASGLPRLPANLQPGDPANPYADYTVERMYQFLSGYALPRDIGAEYEYSNLGMGLLGHALALRGGKSYEELLIEHVLAPLGMDDTRITLTPAMRARLARGHNQEGERVAYWDLPTLAGAGALRSTANDMAEFLAANLDSTGGPLHRALAATHATRHKTETPGLSIGLGWHILDVEGRPIVWHNGGTGGFRSFIGVDQARRAGVIVLANSAEDVDDIGFHLLEPRSPLAPAPKVRAEIALAPAVLDPYVGVYELTPEFRITVTRDGGALFGQATGQERFRLHPESQTDFFLKEVDAQVTFVRDSSGTVTRLVLHQAGRQMPGRKIE
ncbi:MAG: serine hydrolase [Gemmatimonadales bacterium]